MKRSINYVMQGLMALLLWSCHLVPKKLPLLGVAQAVKVQTPEGARVDSIYPVIPPFLFTDQEKNPISNHTFKGKIYIADFFFTSCPTICPIMERNMKKVYDLYQSQPGILFLSYTIDPKHDTPEVLKSYSEGLGVSPARWHFVTGQKDSIYNLAIKGYYSPAKKDDNADGGYVHSGGLFLIDKDGHLRGVYDGTNDDEVNQLINDIKVLQKNG